MTDAQLLTAVKTDLGISVSAYDTRLGELIAAAKAAITREGAADLSPSASTEDAQLVIMYAAWLWRARNDGDNAMPRMLRWALNNRIIASKMQTEAGT
jgi:hypothetical protein